MIFVEIIKVTVRTGSRCKRERKNAITLII